jgi:hypothetical protein
MLGADCVSYRERLRDIRANLRLNARRDLVDLNDAGAWKVDELVAVNRWADASEPPRETDVLREQFDTLHDFNVRSERRG